MVISPGLLMLLLVPLVLIPSGRKGRAVVSLAILFAGLLRHFTPVVGGEFILGFFGHRLELYSYTFVAQTLGGVYLLAGFCYLVFLVNRDRGRWFYFFSISHLASAASILFVGDLWSFFIFWELLTISAVVLILLDGKPLLARNYFLFHIAGGISLLTGMAIFYGTGQSGFPVISGGFESIPVLFFLLAVFIKAAVFPFHYWLVGIYPKLGFDLTALFAATTSKIGALGAWYLLPGINLEFVGLVMALGAVIHTLCLLKPGKFLAYHILGRVGLIVAGAGGGGLILHQAGVYQAASSVVYMGLLFMIFYHLRKSDGNYEQSAAVNWYLGIGFVAGVLSITGMPGFNSFINKTLFSRGLEGELATTLFYTLETLTVVSFVRFIHLYFISDTRWKKSRIDLAFLDKAALLLLVALSLFMGIAPGVISGGTIGTEVEFFTAWNILRTLFLIPMGVFVYGLFYWLPKVATIGEVISASRQGLLWIYKYFFGKGLDFLQNIHTGNLRHYLFWVFGALLVTWLYFLYQVESEFIFDNLLRVVSVFTG